jgi:hypothetical protein
MRAPVILFLFAALRPAETTFTRDVAPILYKHCAGCHHANDIAPMPLITYAEARPWAAAIGEQEVTECHTFEKDTYITSLTPHMHLRGKAMQDDGDLSRRPTRNPALRAALRFQLADHLPRRAAHLHSEEDAYRGGGTPRQWMAGSNTWTRVAA